MVYECMRSFHDRGGGAIPTLPLNYNPLKPNFMPKLSKGLQQENISRIRRLLVLKPDATAREISEATHLDKEYVQKLIGKIRGERAKRMDLKTIDIVLAEFEDVLSESDKRLWKIVNNETASDKNVIAALRELRSNIKEVFDKMFDAGIFERQLGKATIEHKVSPERVIFLRKAFDNAFGTTKKSIAEPTEE